MAYPATLYASPEYRPAQYGSTFRSPRNYGRPLRYSASYEPSAPFGQPQYFPATQPSYPFYQAAGSFGYTQPRPYSVAGSYAPSQYLQPSSFYGQSQAYPATTNLSYPQNYSQTISGYPQAIGTSAFSASYAPPLSSYAQTSAQPAPFSSYAATYSLPGSSTLPTYNPGSYAASLPAFPAQGAPAPPALSSLAPQQYTVPSDVYSTSRAQPTFSSYAPSYPFAGRFGAVAPVSYSVPGPSYAAPAASYIPPSTYPFSGFSSQGTVFSGYGLQYGSQYGSVGGYPYGFSPLESVGGYGFPFLALPSPPLVAPASLSIPVFEREVAAEEKAEEDEAKEENEVEIEVPREEPFDLDTSKKDDDAANQ